MPSRRPSKPDASKKREKRSVNRKTTSSGGKKDKGDKRKRSADAKKDKSVKRKRSLKETTNTLQPKERPYSAEDNCAICLEVKIIPLQNAKNLLKVNQRSYVNHGPVDVVSLSCSVHGTLKLQCGHTFHIKCIRRWLFTHTTCPECRANTDTRKVPGLDLILHKCHCAINIQ